MEKIIRKDPFSILLYQDECGVQVGGSKTRIWSIKGKTAQTVSSGKRANVKIIGTVNFHSGDVFAMELENYFSNTFEKFLQEVVDRYPGKNIFMVLDNAVRHKSKSLDPFFEQNPQLKLLFLPPYAPELNPIEKLWKWMKNSVIHNKLFTHKFEIRDAIADFFQNIDYSPSMICQKLGINKM